MLIQFQFNGRIKQEKVVQTLRRMANLMQIYVISQFGCGIGNRFPREMPTKEKNRQLQYVLFSLLSWIVHYITCN